MGYSIQVDCSKHTYIFITITELNRQNTDRNTCICKLLNKDEAEMNLTIRKKHI